MRDTSWCDRLSIIASYQQINTMHQVSVKQSSLVKDLRESLARLDLQHRQKEEQEAARRQLAEPVDGGKHRADGGDDKDGGRGNPIDVETSMSFRSGSTRRLVQALPCGRTSHVGGFSVSHSKPGMKYLLRLPYVSFPVLTRYSAKN